MSMANKGILAYSMMVVIGFSAIISIPVVLLFTAFSPHILIEDSPDPFIYTSQNSTAIHKLNIITDVGNIKVTYTYEPVNYFAFIRINIEGVGQNLPSKSYADFFKISKMNTNSSITLKVELLSESWNNPRLWITRNLSILVTLNPNILFDINTTIKGDGVTKIIINGGTNVHNVETNIANKGTIIMDFSHCTIEGNIKGFSNSGDILLKTNDVSYLQNSKWDINNIEGETELDIYQFKEMGSNITCTARTNSGVINLIYKELLSKAAAIVYLINVSREAGHVYRGFTQSILKKSGSSYGYLYTSTDFPAKSNFNLTLWKPVGLGEISINIDNQ
ncbi:MAG: hypothetical protein ACXABO_01245 [Promethearchaeota archaeon]|jgi:hypothetical protein